MSLLFVLMFYYTWRIWQANVFGIIECTMQAVNIFFLLSLPDDEKDRILGLFVKWFGIIIIIGLAIYITSFVLKLPYIGVVEGDYGTGESTERYYKNYLFLLSPIDEFSSFVRFRGPFMEPGDLGCVAAFFLFATKFNFKKYKYLWAVAVGLLFCFSLAGYALFLVAACFTFFSKGKSSKRNSRLLLGFLLLLFMYGSFYNGGDNIVNKEILSRLQSDEDKGISGNNRTSLTKVAYFYSMFNDSHTLWFGYDTRTIEVLNEEKTGDGFITYAIQFGFVGMILMVLPYLFFSLSSKQRRYAIQFLIIFLLYFSQRASVEWIAYIICFVNGIVIDEREYRGKSLAKIEYK